MNKLKHLFLISVLLFIFIGMSCVSAGNMDSALLNNQTPPNDHSPTENITVIGSYEDLNNDIQNLQPGDTYNIDKDYYFDGNEKIIFVDSNVITIDKDNTTINGNGHVIDAGGVFYALFKVTGNNVKIFNLTFINSKPSGLIMPMIFPSDDSAFRRNYNDVSSPINWYGDNGVIADCKFINNEAINGGAISWKGNNGIINNCTFINNTARGIGGAIYMVGSNNTMCYSRFVNSFSQLSHEAIYLDRNRKNINFTECEFGTGGKYIIDGTVTDIDVYYLYYDICSYISDIKFNLVYLMYSSIMNNGLNYMDNGISYYAQYNNETCDFVLTLIRNFNEYGISYRKDYIFKNITDLNKIFNLMYDGKFVNDLIFMVNKTVNNSADYKAARTTEAVDSILLIGDLLERDLEGYFPLNSKKFVLNINFESKLSIKCTEPLIPDVLGFDIIIINGHGSTISGTFDESDEYSWVKLVQGYTLIASDLCIAGYNCAVRNMGGNCIFNNVIFKENKMDYWFERDWGGAILNTGVVVCNNCTFTNNYAKHGGAIFNQGLLILDNCTFSNNKAYGKGDNVCMGNGGKANVNGVNITSDRGPIYFADSIDVSDISIITMWSFASTIVLSILAGAFTGGFLIAVAVGMVIGAICGSISAAVVCSSVFDVNFSTKSYAALIIGTSILVGAVSAVIGATFFSGVTSCDLWCLNCMDGPDYIFFSEGTASSASFSAFTV